MLTSELASIWITSDGRKFFSEKEAKIHESKLSVEVSISEWERVKEEKQENLKDQIKEISEWLERQQQNLK